MKIRFAHKLIAFLLLLILPVFVMKRYTLLKHTTRGKFEKQDISLNSNYQLNDKKFHIIAIDNDSFNEKIINSILDQNYTNFAIELLGFNQSDKEKIQSLIKLESNKRKVDFAYCSDNKDLIKKFHKYVSSLDDDCVVVYLGSNNYLANKRVLENINDIYKTENVYLCFGQYSENEVDKKAMAQSFTPRKEWSLKKKQKSFWLQSYVKIFYAGLYKQLNLKESELTQFDNIEDFLTYNMQPIAEMSKKHIRFIPEVLYIHKN